MSQPLPAATAAGIGAGQALAIVPARYASSRFPGKALALLGGRPLFVHTAERAASAERVARVLVATDDERIRAAAQAHGLDVVLTTAPARTGTDRVAMLAGDAPRVINVQGDEVLIDPQDIDAVVAALDHAPVATAAAPIDEAQDDNLVKVVFASDGTALYFSRAPIPSGGPHWGHIGIYGFRRDALARFASLPTGRLETSERLEQLRLLEHGIDVHVVQLSRYYPSVNTPGDLDRVRELWTQQHSLPDTRS